MGEIDDSSPTEARIPIVSTGPAAKCVLVIVSPSGMLTCALPEEGSITVGRSRDCGIRIEDAKASRTHAAVRVTPDRVTVEDLASLNGTRVGDRNLTAHEPVELRPGDMVSIGSTALVVQLASMHSPPLRLWSQNAFEERLDEERLATQRRAGTFGLLRLEVAQGEASIALASTSTKRARNDLLRGELLEKAFSECLRPIDVVGSTMPGLYEILLPGTAAGEALGIGALLRRHLRERGIAHGLRVAGFPRDGGTRDELLEAAQDLDDDDPAVAPAEEPAHRLAPMVQRIAQGEINVVILGETGVGKEVLSRAIHARSPRATRALVCINCAALSETLLESELFGHEKGAFTGAVQAKAGLLESAEGGTVFLDEVGEMPLSLQAKLLRVLEQREVLRVGSLRPRPIDVRFLAATNRDLEAEVAAGRFRQDLYFRLNGVSIVIPPLRERVEEIAPLARAFVARAAERSRREPVPRLSPEFVRVVERYPWPGNVRELRNAMERAVLLTTGDAVTMESFPSELMGGPVVAIRSSGTSKGYPAAARPTLAPAAEAKWDAEKVPMVDLDVGILPERTERDQIVAALDACGGNQTQAAKLLSISRRTLVSRLRDYELPRPRKK